jgi:hypothetical protein
MFSYVVNLFLFWKACLAGAMLISTPNALYQREYIWRKDTKKAGKKKVFTNK